jgi:hypothetical protein
MCAWQGVLSGKQCTQWQTLGYLVTILHFHALLTLGLQSAALRQGNVPVHCSDRSKLHIKSKHI